MTPTLTPDDWQEQESDPNHYKLWQLLICLLIPAGVVVWTVWKMSGLY